MHKIFFLEKRLHRDVGKKKIHTIDPLRLKLFWNILILWLRSRGIFESGFSSDVSATTSGKLCRFIFRSMRLYFTSSNSRFLSENLSGSDDRLKIERVIDGWALRDIYIYCGYILESIVRLILTEVGGQDCAKFQTEIWGSQLDFLERRYNAHAVEDSFESVLKSFEDTCVFVIST